MKRVGHWGVLIAGLGLLAGGVEALETRSAPGILQAEARVDRTTESWREDLEAVCQLAIDLPFMELYWHVDEDATRRPLVIVRNHEIFEEPLLLTKFGEPVVFVPEFELAAQKLEAFLVFTQLEVSADSARVRFEYPVEGTGGEATFRKRDGAWEVVTFSGGWER